MCSWNSIVGSMNNTKGAIEPMNNNKNKLNNGKNIRVKMRRWSYQTKSKVNILDQRQEQRIKP